MKMSRLFGQTLRETPADADVSSHQLLMRAGFIRPLGVGIFSYLHLAQRSMQKIEAILRAEMDNIAGQEISMPVVQPADLWKETGRWYQVGSELAQLKDRNDHDMVLAMTHEEVVADLARHEVQSYKQLPRLLYHIQTKFRDESRSRAGLIRVREFTMKDSYSLDADWDGLDKQYRLHYQAYFNIFGRCALPVIAVKSDPGIMGGKLAHEYMYRTSIGEDALILCDNCGYSANRQVARFRKPIPQAEELKPLEKVHTPGCKSIDDLANFLQIPNAKTAKAVFFMAVIPSGKELIEKFIFAVVRGDMDLNETKLSNAVGARELRPATEEEILAVGAVPGYASPLGLKNVVVVVDDDLPVSPNLVAGANENGYHLLNTNYPRDYAANLVTDITAAQAGQSCPECGSPLRMEHAVEVGHIFKLGTCYSEALGCTFLDKDGQQKPIIMGSYGIGVGRLLACIAEEHHDEHGLIWPVTIAPYQVHLILLRGKGDSKCEEFALQLYDDLRTAGIEVLFDDREESPGVKFNDADLVGLPLRITVSERALAQGGFECKLRSEVDKTLIPRAEALAYTRSRLSALFKGIEANLKTVEYN